MSGATAPTSDVPQLATSSVLKPSSALPDGTREIKGIDFNQHADKDLTVVELMASMATMGFQASALAEAVRIVNEMVQPPEGKKRAFQNKQIFKHY